MKTAAQTAVIMAIVTLLSKCLGFVREMVLANYFGTSFVTDSYVMAIGIPSIIFGGILGAISVAYMPIYSNILENEGSDKSNEFTSGVLKVLVIVSIISSLVGIVCSDFIVSIFARGFEGETANLTSYFLKVAFSYLALTATADILEAFLRYKGTFIPQVAFGFLQNLILISTIIISSFTSHYNLIFGYLLVYTIRLIIMAAIARRRDFKYKRKAKINKAIIRIFSLSAPVFIGNGLIQINTFVDRMLASGLKVGSVAALNYGNLLVGMIMGLTITIMTTIIYPRLTQASSLNDTNRLSNIVSTGTILILVIATPCSLGALVYSKPIVQIVYERGAFDSLATTLTASAFFYYSIGIIFLSINSLFIQLYYSMQNMKTPVLFSGIGVIINIILNLILVKRMELSGLALATSLSALCVSILFIINISKKYQGIDLDTIKFKVIKIVIATAVSIGTPYALFKILIADYSTDFIIKSMQLLLIVLSTMVIYLVLLVMFKIDEIKMIKLVFKR